MFGDSNSSKECLGHSARRSGAETFFDRGVTKKRTDGDVYTSSWMKKSFDELSIYGPEESDCFQGWHLNNVDILFGNDAQRESYL